MAQSKSLLGTVEVGGLGPANLESQQDTYVLTCLSQLGRRAQSHTKLCPALVGKAAWGEGGLLKERACGLYVTQQRDPGKL